VSIETSTELKDLFAAMAEAQGEMQPAIKTATNPAFKRAGSNGSKYADLAACMKALQEVLKKHGLFLSQMYGGPEIVTTLGHKSGQFMRGTVPIPNFNSLTPQQIGSATTYLRRYSLGIVGLVTEEDDDGNAASEERTPSKKAQAVATEFLASLNCDEPGNTEEQQEASKAARVLAVHKSIDDKELYEEAWALLDPKQRKAIKTYIDMTKKAAA
jgi:hypothetical protein